MVFGAKVCELTDGFFFFYMQFVCGNFDVSPYPLIFIKCNNLIPTLASANGCL